MRQYHCVGQFDGAVLAFHGGNVVLEKAYGEANREWGVANTVDTRFRLGSLSKHFTAALILKLVEDGHLDLEGKISDYLPDFRKDIGEVVTIHHLLTHSSGIAMPGMSSEEYWAFFEKRWTTRQLVENLCTGELAFTPGEKFGYSSAGYILLGAIVEQVTGNSYEEELKEKILDPLGMDGTGIDNPETIISKRASGYQANYGFGNSRYKYMPASFSSGGLYSTVGDIHKWHQALLSDSILGPKMKKLMFTPHIKCGSGWHGYGCFIRQVPGPDNSTLTRIFHGGDVSGFCAFFVRELESGDCVALLSNRECVNYEGIANNLLDTLHGKKPITPLPFIADLLRKAIFTNGLDDALELYAQVESEGLDGYSADEAELTELGYDLLRIDQVDSAIEVFKINIELHSDSADAWDSLGEGYFVAGDHETAISCYEKALEVDPAYSHARKMLLEVKAAIKNK